MSGSEASPWLADAIHEFNRHESRDDGARTVTWLTTGLTVLGRLTYDRVHRDVQQEIGADSMLMPLSEAKAQRRTTAEIEAFQIAESAAITRELGYVAGSDPWYVEWLAELRSGPPELRLDVHRRCLGYLAQSADDRRLAFSDALGRVLPESRQAPLVLFQLLPLAIRIATASAFSDQTTASGLRGQQVALLPAIADCRECQGRLLECGELCRACGNPLWKYEWLTVVG